MGFGYNNCIARFLMIFIGAFLVCLAGAETSRAEVTVESQAAGYGVIKGVVRDSRGKPISKATVAVFRLGSSKLLKQVTASKTGRFFTKIVPGTYTVLAVAQGFNPFTVEKVEVGRASELVYGFKLERAGSGNTVPEKRADRKSAKWAVRASRRSIYQIDQGTAGVSGETTADLESEEAAPAGEEFNRPSASVLETFAGTSSKGTVNSVNFATLQPVGESSDILVAGQINKGRKSGNRFETAFSFSPGRNHRVRFRGSVAQLGDLPEVVKEESLSQFSFQATDQWQVREGIVLLLGVDYSKFLGAGDASSLSPRIGVQYDLDSRTRVRSAYTTRTEERSWSKVIQLENSQVLFADPVSVNDISMQDGEAEMNRSTRFEFGFERVLDNRSTVEANAFIDTVKGRGVGLDRVPFGGSGTFNKMVGRHEGGATGMRVVLNRRFNSVFSGSTGYAFGSGQQLSAMALTEPGNFFDNGFFNTVFGQIVADLDTGTTIKTVFRFSPKATVFAIDPFEGRLAIYDPGLSIMLTQSLPSLGLPIDAEATLDARNVFDLTGGITGHDGSLFLSSQRRMIRGGIMVRF